MENRENLPLILALVQRPSPDELPYGDESDDDVEPDCEVLDEDDE